MMKLIKTYLITLSGLIIIGELGNRFSSFKGQGGDFFMFFFWCAIISGIFSLLYCLNTEKDD